MTETKFRIQSTDFSARISGADEGFVVQSVPRPYTVGFPHSEPVFSWLAEEISRHEHSLVLIDAHVKDGVLGDLDLSPYPVYRMEAKEENKDIQTVLDVCDFLLHHKANRGSMYFVIGGGIVQDIGAFSGYMYKRGIPWTFVPTTLLAQADSCVGGKTAVNRSHTKNILALFSAPRQVLIDSAFSRTLSRDDLLSGGGEIFRLTVTGGEGSLACFDAYLEAFLRGEEEAIRVLTACSLSVKRQIVEADEFEIDLRRSMNYGHSVGHAIEALSEYRIPHGLGVAIGMLIENRISRRRGLLSVAEEERLLALGLRLVPRNMWAILAELPLDDLLERLASDKKVVGSVLKLATLEAIGRMVFLDLPLDRNGDAEVRNAISEVLEVAMK